MTTVRSNAFAIQIQKQGTEIHIHDLKPDMRKKKRATQASIIPCSKKSVNFKSNYKNIS
jgi:hypothetical protein